MKSFILISFLCLFSCKKKKNIKHLTWEAPLKEIQIVVDQSFEPIIEKQLKVFHSQHKEIKVNTFYTSQNESIGHFLRDENKISLLISSRKLSPLEEKAFSTNFFYPPNFLRLAHEPIILLVHQKNRKKSFSKEDLTLILSDLNSKRAFIYDKFSDSIIRALVKFTGIKEISKNIKGIKKKEDFFNLLNSNKNFIGFISLSDLLAFEEKKNYMKKISIASFFINQKVLNPYFDNFLINKNYPLMKSIFCTLKENYFGPAKKLFFFLSGQKGGLIFNKSRYLPIQITFELREIKLGENEFIL